MTFCVYEAQHQAVQARDVGLVPRRHLTADRTLSLEMTVTVFASTACLEQDQTYVVDIQHNPNLITLRSFTGLDGGQRRLKKRSFFTSYTLPKIRRYSSNYLPHIPTPSQSSLAKHVQNIVELVHL